jgi:hypothetical protein
MFFAPRPGDPQIVTTSGEQSDPTKALLWWGWMSNTAPPVFTNCCSRDHHMGHLRSASELTGEAVQPSCPKTCKLNPYLYCSCMRVSNDHVQHPSRLIRDLAEGLDLHAACLPCRNREGFWVGRWEELRPPHAGKASLAA